MKMKASNDIGTEDQTKARLDGDLKGMDKWQWQEEGSLTSLEHVETLTGVDEQPKTIPAL
ncbi:hypothetical protein PM082_007541 [Marasmius tenuissimus]|nr:hypothetical protein PM082_007541 [Marasmius tenuissimus]